MKTAEQIAEDIKNAKRYEVVRRLSIREFRALIIRNVKGENFDEMIDELVKQNENSNRNK